MKLFLLIVFCFLFYQAFAVNAKSDSLYNQLEDASAKEKPLLLNTLAESYFSVSSDSCMEYANQALLLARKYKNITQEARSLHTLGRLFLDAGNTDKAIEYWEQELSIRRWHDDEEVVAALYNSIGLLYRDIRDFDKATSYIKRALVLLRRNEDRNAMAEGMFNIGNMYFRYDNNKQKALDYYRESFRIFEEVGNTGGMAKAGYNIGLINFKFNKPYLAIEYLKETRKLYIASKKSFENGKVDNLIGEIYLTVNDFKNSLKYLSSAKLYCDSSENTETAIQVQNMLGELFIKTKDYKKAIINLKIAKSNATTYNLPEYLPEIYKNLSNASSFLAQSAQALLYYQRHTEIKDSLETIENAKRIALLKEKDRKKKIEIRLLLKEQQIKEREIKIQKRLTFSFVSTSVLIFIVVVLVFYQYLQKKRINKELEKRNAEILKQNQKIENQRDEIQSKNTVLNQQNEEIEAQRDEIEAQRDRVIEQRDEIARQKQNITDGIMYAGSIQNAMLPPKAYFDNNLEDYFILYLPKEIVSGDFYWITNVNNKIILTAADCTGHGVPGAFMSVLGISLLEEIIDKQNITQPSLILDELKKQVQKALHQTGRIDETKDGMDMALCSIDKEKKVIEFAGAYNPLIKISDGQLTKIRGDRMPIGIHFIDKGNFKNHSIKYNSSDVFYMFSDGYSDQFGGDNEGRKYLMKNLEALLLKIHTENFANQKKILLDEHRKWRGTKYEQIDDILILGFKL